MPLLLLRWRQKRGLGTEHQGTSCACIVCLFWLYGSFLQCTSRLNAMRLYSVPILGAFSGHSIRARRFSARCIRARCIGNQVTFSRKNGSVQLQDPLPPVPHVCFRPKTSKPAPPLLHGEFIRPQHHIYFYFYFFLDTAKKNLHVSHSNSAILVNC